MIVLYVDDDIEDVDIFSELLHMINPSIKCLNASNGAEAITLLEDAIILPDYIFLDINMPTMNGKECLKRIVNDNRFRIIPVVMFSTSQDEIDIEYCKELGADYVQKPNTIADAIKRLTPFFQETAKGISS